MERTSFVYQSHFCEENVYLMAQQLLNGDSKNDGTEYHVVFISSQSKETPIWRQRASQDQDNHPVIWDYHVVLVATGNTHEIREHGLTLMFDLDSCLEFPISASMYCTAAFRPDRMIPKEHEQTFRVIPAAMFLDYFASDRSHMLASKLPFPSWPLLQGKHANTTMNLHEYIRMHSNEDGQLMVETRPGFGRVMNRTDFCAWCNAIPWS